MSATLPNGEGRRVLVTGGRDYADRARVFAELDAIARVFGISLLIHGGAKGADALAEKWASVRGVDTEGCKADWERHGAAAGPIRNSAMLRDHKPDMVLAFPGGKGTEDMMRKTLKAGLPLIVIRSALATVQP